MNQFGELFSAGFQPFIIASLQAAQTRWVWADGKNNAHVVAQTTIVMRVPETIAKVALMISSPEIMLKAKGDFPPF